MLLSNAWWGSKLTGLTPVSYAAFCDQCKTTQGCTKFAFNQVLQFPLSLAFSGAGCLSQKLLRVPPVPRAVPDWVPAQAHPGAAENTCYLYTAATASASRLNKLATTTTSR